MQKRSFSFASLKNASLVTVGSLFVAFLTANVQTDNLQARLLVDDTTSFSTTITSNDDSESHSATSSTSGSSATDTDSSATSTTSSDASSTSATSYDTATSSTTTTSVSDDSSVTTTPASSSASVPSTTAPATGTQTDEKLLKEKYLEMIRQKSETTTNTMMPATTQERPVMRYEDQKPMMQERSDSFHTGADEMLKRKEALMQQIKEMEALTHRLQELKQLASDQLHELQNVQKEISSYNFVGSAGADIKDKIEQFVQSAQEQGLSRDEIKAKIMSLKGEAMHAMDESRQEKFKQKMIPFLDTDDNAWFTEYAAKAKEKGWIKGTGESGYTKVNPEAQTNVAEAVTMMGRMMGANDTTQPESTVGRELPEWARGSATALENVGVDLDTLFGDKNPGDTVSRADVARMLKMMLNLKAGTASEFKDIGEANHDEQSAIRSVKAAGIMTGEGDGSEFNPHGALNRAALMKIMMTASQLKESTPATDTTTGN